MTQELWSKVDDYINESLVPGDAALENAVKKSNEAGLPQIQVSPSQGKLLQVLACIIKAKRILEIGTLGAYSTIWLARALPPDGKLITLEINPRYAEVARRNLQSAHLSPKVTVKVGPALESLSHLQTAGEAPFDLVFIDADKEGYPKYLQKALPLLREGGLVLADNALPDAVLDPKTDHGIKRFNAELSAHPDLISVLVPVLRSRGFEGLTISAKQRL